MAQVAQPRQESRTDSRSVLIVEDDWSSRRALARLLLSCGYRTWAVASAEEALNALNNASLPSIALIDLDLPGMSGLDLISILGDYQPKVYPVLITATDQETLTRRLGGKRVTYLRKPLDFEKLLTILGDQRSAS